MSVVILPNDCNQNKSTHVQVPHDLIYCCAVLCIHVVVSAMFTFSQDQAVQLVQRLLAGYKLWLEILSRIHLYVKFI